MNKHTPAPWKFGQTLNQGLAVWHSKIGEPDYIIAMHHGSGDKAYADVKLICAAPDMLNALKLIQQLMSNLMAKGNINWGQTFGIDFGLMNEALIAMDRAVADAEKKVSL